MSANAFIRALSEQVQSRGQKTDPADTPSMPDAPEEVRAFVQVLASHSVRLSFGELWVRRSPGQTFQTLESAFDLCGFDEWPSHFPGDKSVIFGEHPGGLFYVGISWHTQEPQLVFADTGEFLFEEAPVEAYADAQPALALIHALNKAKPNEELQALAEACGVKL